MQEFEVPSMSCGHCLATVTEAIKSLDPQAKVEVDLPTKKVRVETSKDRESVALALSEAGYKAS